MTRAESRRILFVAPSAYTLGGLATWLDYLVPGLRQKGWDAYLGLVQGPRHHKPSEYLRVHPDPQWVAVRCDTGTSQGRRDAVKRAVRKVKPDMVVSVNIPDSLVAVAELRAMGASDARAVMACHGIQRDLFDDMRLLRNFMDAVVCVNRLACRLAETLGSLDTARVLYAECGTEWPSKLDPPNERSRFTLAYVGRLEQDQKRIFDLVTILKHLHEMKVSCDVIVAGNGPEDNAFRQSLQSLPATGAVRLLGHVASQDMPAQVYQAADAIIVTSSWETGPIVIWEAMARRVAVVSSRYLGSGLQGIQQDEENCLLFDVGDAAGAARQIARLSADPSLLARLRQRGRDTIRERLTTDLSVEQWDRAFRQALEITPTPLGKPNLRPVASGRLDRLLGPALAERLRAAIGRRGPDTGSSGEWPHTLTGTDNAAAEFWRLAELLDCGTEPDDRQETELLSTIAR